MLDAPPSHLSAMNPTRTNMEPTALRQGELGNLVEKHRTAW